MGGETAYKAVQETFNHTATEVYVIEVKQEKITTTEEHPFWIVGKVWGEAGDLVVRDVLVDRDGKDSPIEAITVRKEPTKVYNFRVQGYYNYFVTDLRIWTHNCGGGGRGIGSSTSSTIYSSPGNVSRGSNILTKNVPVSGAYQKCIRDQFNSFKASKGTGNTPTLRSQGKPYENHTTVQKTKTFRSLKTTGTSNSSVDLYDENSKLIQRRYYDKMGEQKKILIMNTLMGIIATHSHIDILGIGVVVLQKEAVTNKTSIIYAWR